MENKPKRVRADHWLRDQFPSLTARQREQALELKLVTGENNRAVRKGDYISSLNCQALEAHLQTLRAGNPALSISIVYEDNAFAIIDKPAGIPSHPIDLLDFGTVTHWAFAQWPDLHQEFSEFAQPTLTPHRLDTGTSGALIVAKTQAAYNKWRQEFSYHKVKKSYLAWVWGNPGNRLVDFAIAHDPKDRRKMSVCTDDATSERSPRTAKSQVNTLRQSSQLSLCEVHCQTGVTHQVRVHLASLGCPIVGDTLYDPSWEQREIRPSHFLLRAVTVERESTVYRVDSEEFQSQFP